VRRITAFLWIAAAVFLSIGHASAAAPGCIIPSPDHPGTWEVGANDKLSQRLQWDEKTHILFLNVVYAYVPNSDRWNPTEQESYRLHFPNVLWDRKTDDLYVPGKANGKIVIGRLSKAFSGHRVELDQNVEAVAHRHGKRIDAALIVH
jgi:hypothetical protein